LPDNVKVRIHKNGWAVPDIFKLIQLKGGIEDKEMYHTFNMGVGMVLIVEKESARAIIAKLSEMKLKSWVVGEVVKGRKEVEVV
jgi:phosphoribosylformylglycinamidine cyclo-ligase